MEQERTLIRWEELRERLLAEAKEICPSWTDYNSTDTGVVLAELFAWLGQIQMFEGRQITKEHEMQYLRLMGIRGLTRRPASVWLTADTEGSVRIPAGFQVRAGEVCFETEEEYTVTEHIFKTLRFPARGGDQALEGNWIEEGRGIRIRPFGEEPRPGAVFVMELKNPLPLGRRQLLYLETGRRPWGIEGDFGQEGFYPLAEMEMEYRTEKGWQKVRKGKDGTWSLLWDGAMEFWLEEPMSREKPALRLVLGRYDYLEPPCILRLSLAMFPARQAETLNQKWEMTGNGLPDQTFDLGEEGLITESGGKNPLRVWVQNPLNQAEMEEWNQAEYFYFASPDSKIFQIEKGVLKFGNGFWGMAPEGKILAEGGAKTLGSLGNVQAGSIRQTAELPEGLKAVFNEKAAFGGMEEESLREAVRRKQEERRQKKRAVTFQDYEEMAKSIPGIDIDAARAFADPKRPGTVVLVVKPKTREGRGRLNEAIKINLKRYFERKRLLGTQMVFSSPVYAEVHVFCRAIVKAGWRQGRELIREAIRHWIEGKKIGEPALLGELAGVLGALECLEEIESLYLDGRPGSRNERGDFMVAGNVQIYPGQIEVTAAAGRGRDRT